MRSEFEISHIIPELQRNNLLPAIVFRTSRSQCDVDAERAAASRELRLPPPAQRELRETIHRIIDRYDMDRDLILTHPQYQGLLQTGVGAHHAGQLLMWRLLLEELMAEGILKVLIATGTVAAGVDFPARTVVITAHSRRGAEGFASLTAAELQQMSGRAGRRGKDTVGFCLVAPAPFCDARTVLRISKRPPEPLVSAYFPGPSTVLNLLRYRNVDDLRFTVSRSLASYVDRREAKKMLEDIQFQLSRLPEAQRARLETAFAAPDVEQSEEIADHDNREGRRLLKKLRRLRRQAVELERRQELLLESALEGLQTLGYVEGANLSTKGYWAAHLCTSVVLEMGEIIESKILDGASAEKMTAVLASICGDDHRQYLETKRQWLSKEEIQQLTTIVGRVGKTGMPGVSESRKVLSAAADTVVEWMHAESWQQFRGILTLSGVAEGDAARLITQTAEQLNQITRLSETHQALALRAEEAKRRILRPPLTEVINFESF